MHIVIFFSGYLLQLTFYGNLAFLGFMLQALKMSPAMPAQTVHRQITVSTEYKCDSSSCCKVNKVAKHSSHTLNTELEHGFKLFRGPSRVMVIQSSVCFVAVHHYLISQQAPVLHAIMSYMLTLRDYPGISWSSVQVTKFPR